LEKFTISLDIELLIKLKIDPGHNVNDRMERGHIYSQRKRKKDIKKPVIESSHELIFNTPFL
jgi:hypothetical protein